MIIDCTSSVDIQEKMGETIKYLTDNKCEVIILNRYASGKNSDGIVYKSLAFDNALNLKSSRYKRITTEITIANPDICHLCGAQCLYLIPFIIRHKIKCIVDVQDSFFNYLYQKFSKHAFDYLYNVNEYSNIFELADHCANQKKSSDKQKNLAIYQLGDIESFKTAEILIDSCSEIGSKITFLGEFKNIFVEDMVQRRWKISDKGSRYSKETNLLEQSPVFLILRVNLKHFLTIWQAMNLYIENDVVIVCFDCKLFRNLFGDKVIYDDFKSRIKLSQKLSIIKTDYFANSIIIKPYKPYGKQLYEKLI